ncbi:MAG TPA: hypothetical protein VMF06_05115 [Candidatus Limnocylindria bacterium]|nr:hypothetical protein [Candidatus Limnocylindria bacterium]
MKLLVLGAGCSCKYGYPLAKQMRAHLSVFAESAMAHQPAIANLARKTEHLYGQFKNLDTLDELVRAMNQRAENAEPPLMLDEESDRQIETAKAAISAMFRDKERAAIESGLKGYKDWFKRAFGNDSCETALKKTPWRVLSFNYDLLFELAFHEYFGIPNHANYIYSSTYLNSGFLLGTQQISDIDSGRFSFLKLHGSVGMSCYSFGGWRFHPPVPNSRAPYSLKADDFFDGERVRKQLIVFPHEKSWVNSNRYDQRKLPFAQYINNVWATAKIFAAQADEIHIIGYSVDNIDWIDFSSILNAAYSHGHPKILIEDPFMADSIAEFLKGHLPVGADVRAIKKHFERQ